MDSSNSAEIFCNNNVENGLNENNMDANREKLQRNLAFWKSNYNFLLKPHVVIFAGIVDNILTSCEVLEIMKQLLSLRLINNVKALFPLSNKAFTFVEFSDKECAGIFQKMSSVIGKINTVFVNVEPPAKFINIFVDKLPTYVLLEYLPKLLNTWGEVISIIPAHMNLVKGVTCANGSNKVRFKLKNEYTALDIPYFVKIEYLKIYLHIPLRPKICFRCMAQDHLVSACTYSYCRQCRSYKDPLHKCLLSYANRVARAPNPWHAALIQAQEESISEDISQLYEQEDLKSRKLIDSKDAEATLLSKSKNKQAIEDIASDFERIITSETIIEEVNTVKANTMENSECVMNTTERVQENLSEFEDKDMMLSDDFPSVNNN